MSSVKVARNLLTECSRIGREAAMARAWRRQALRAALLALLVLGLCAVVAGKGKKAKTKAKGAAGAAAPPTIAANIDLSAEYSAKQYGKAIPITPNPYGAVWQGRQSMYGVKEAQILKSPCMVHSKNLEVLTLRISARRSPAPRSSRAPATWRRRHLSTQAWKTISGGDTRRRKNSSCALSSCPRTTG